MKYRPPNYTKEFLQERQRLAEAFWREFSPDPKYQWKNLPIEVRMHWLGRAADYQRSHRS